MEFEYVAPATLEEATRVLADAGEETKLIAGGVVLLTLLRRNLVAPRLVVSIRELEELKGIRWDDGHLVLGALTTHREVERSPVVAEACPVLKEMEEGLGSVQVRNAGTIGGNLAHADPAEDPAPVLIALSAQVRTASVRGARTLPIEDLFVDYLTTQLAPDEVLAEVRIPRPPPRTGTVYLKHSVRNAVDFPVAGVAVNVTIDERGRCTSGRIALSAVGNTPILCRSAFEPLLDEVSTDGAIGEAARRAAAEAQPQSDGFGSAEYKRHLVRVLTARAVEAAYRRAVADDEVRSVNEDKPTGTWE